MWTSHSSPGLSAHEPRDGDGGPLRPARRLQWRAASDVGCPVQGLARGASAAATALRARQLELRLAAGVELIAVLGYGTPWASSLTEDDDKFPPDDPADFGSFVTAVAEHYTDRIQSYELWNEPNAGYRFFKPEMHGDAAHFADILQSGAQAIRTTCPSCEVISGGLFFHEQLINGAVEFTHDMLTARPDGAARIRGHRAAPTRRHGARPRARTRAARCEPAYRSDGESESLSIPAESRTAHDVLGVVLPTKARRIITERTGSPIYLVP